MSECMHCTERREGGYDICHDQATRWTSLTPNGCPFPLPFGFCDEHYAVHTRQPLPKWVL